MPPEQLAKLLRELSPTERARYKHTWSAWARPEQLEPAGKWFVWLLLAGRGFGKTRTGAEWVHQRVEDGASRIALVARTAAEVRDVIVEGESGILACAPPWNRPKYEPSKRRVTWPNGARATTYSADEPDALRGPQHDTGWADELACFIAGTLVQTDRGPKPIERVTIGDHVHTTCGLQSVENAWCSSPAAECFRLRTSDGRELVGTGHHRIWTKEKGFAPLASLQYGDTLEAWEHQGPASFGAVDDGGSTVATTATGEAACSTGRSTPPRMVRSRQGSSSTTATRTRRTIASTTSRRSPSPSTAASTSADTCDGHGRSGRGRAPISGLNESRTRTAAKSAAKNTRRRAPALDSAAECAPLAIGDERIPSRKKVAITSSARPPRADGAASSSRNRTRARSAVRASAVIDTAVRVQSVERLSTRMAVYNLSVSGPEEYFANGIRVHNSWQYPDAWDQLKFGMRLGQNPRICVTTTPRPTTIIRGLVKDASTHITRGNTYDNLANLAPSFIEEIRRQYEGTRLGRQELYAEILDDVEGALWSHDMIDKLRVPQAPELVRTVVAIDPAVTAELESDETGIVVVGLARDGQLYVLADLSGRMSPLDWGRRAVKAFHQFHADRIIAEENNGGKLVEMNLRAIGSPIAYKGVRAAQGKRTRAEPIAALYEQGRAHHVGLLPKLEDQMCIWEPLTGDKSPDRMDALVWGCSELALAPTVRRDLGGWIA